MFSTAQNDVLKRPVLSTNQRYSAYLQIFLFYELESEDLDCFVERNDSNWIIEFFGLKDVKKWWQVCLILFTNQIPYAQVYHHKQGKKQENNHI